MQGRELKWRKAGPTLLFLAEKKIPFCCSTWREEAMLDPRWGCSP